MEEAKTEDVQSIEIFEEIESSGGGHYSAFDFNALSPVSFFRYESRKML